MEAAQGAGWLEQFPEELQVLVWLWLPPKEVFRQALVCRHWARICSAEGEYVWRTAHAWYSFSPLSLSASLSPFCICSLYPGTMAGRQSVVHGSETWRGA